MTGLYPYEKDKEPDIHCPLSFWCPVDIFHKKIHSCLESVWRFCFSCVWALQNISLLTAVITIAIHGNNRLMSCWLGFPQLRPFGYIKKSQTLAFENLACWLLNRACWLLACLPLLYKLFYVTCNPSSWRFTWYIRPLGCCMRKKGDKPSTSIIFNTMHCISELNLVTNDLVFFISCVRRFFCIYCPSEFMG